jgi:hypothetical protein
MPTGPWTTGASQVPGMWFQVELPDAVSLVEVQMNTTTIGGARGGRGGARGGRGVTAPLPDAGFPRRFRVDVSADGRQWTAVAEATGAAVTSTAAFPRIRARFVRITQTGDTPNAPAWTLQRLRLYEAP